MDRTNKYYDIIENLVKHHKKFAGVEAILEDIIEDVYSHSETILNSINNDSVALAYLEKIVSTSIVTVPKKLGFKPEKEQSITTNVDIISAAKVNTEFVDKMINSAQNELINESKNDELSDAQVEEIINDDTELEELIIDECDAQEITEHQDTEVHQTANFEVTIEETCDNDTIEIEEQLEEDTHQIETIETIIDNIEEEVEEEVDDGVNTILDMTDSAENDLDSLLGEDDQENDVLFEFVENTADNSDVEIIEDASELQEYIVDNEVYDNILEIEDVSDNTENLEMLDLSSETQQDLNEIDEINEEEQNFNESTFDFGNFDCTPQDILDEYDINNIKYELESLNAKRPELNIIEIYNLKYCENKTVEQISGELNLSENQVLDALNEIVAIV